MRIFRRKSRPPRDLVALCRMLGQSGWERLHAAQAGGRGIVLCVAPDERARRAVAGWLGVAAGIDADGTLAPQSDDAFARHLRAGKRVALGGPEAAIQAARLADQTGCAVLAVRIRDDRRDGARLCLEPFDV